ncbi:MAG: prepilin peptidase [Oligoflexales bacterium]
MMSASFLLLIILILGLLAAGITDVRHSRIPNWVTFPLAGFGLGVQSWENGWGGLLFSLEGLVVGLVCLMFFYVMGGMGAGDVKLLGAIGTILGPGQVLYIFAFTAILGGMYSVALLFAQGGLGYACERVQHFLASFQFTRTLSVGNDHKKSTAPKLRYALVLGLGTLMTQVLVFYGWL